MCAHVAVAVAVGRGANAALPGDAAAADHSLARAALVHAGGARRIPRRHPHARHRALVRVRAHAYAHAHASSYVADEVVNN